MQTLRQQRLAQKKHRLKLEKQMAEEANGAPIPGDIAEFMTKPKEAEALYQVYVDIRGEHGSRAVSPKFAGDAGAEVCRQVLQQINAKICLGNLKGWGNARVERAVHVTSH